jgi:hypothetical protein
VRATRARAAGAPERPKPSTARPSSERASAVAATTHRVRVGQARVRDHAPRWADGFARARPARERPGCDQAGAASSAQATGHVQVQIDPIEQRTRIRAR